MAPPPGTDRQDKKVSLERYRAASYVPGLKPRVCMFSCLHVHPFIYSSSSRAIFKVLLDVVGPAGVEKAGVDEVCSSRVCVISL